MSSRKVKKEEEEAPDVADATDTDLPPTKKARIGQQSAGEEESSKRVPKKEEEVDDDGDEDEEAFGRRARRARRQDGTDDRSRRCPYLDTINRNMLDFDFEKLCSVTMSNQNVYACLVCGKYYQGRGPGTHAYTHSLEEGHHVFINLHTLKFYCLPDNYEVIDSALDDIKFVLYPVYSKDYIAKMDEIGKYSRALDGTRYLPGVVGLNNIKANDYVNVVVQTLNRVAPFRNFFLDTTNTRRIRDRLVQTMGDLIRKVNNPKAFKGHVSPHEFLQAITTSSKKQFRITEQSDPIRLLSWLLNTLDAKLSKHGHTVISDTFKGKMLVTSRKLPPTQDMQEVANIRIDPNAEEYKPKTTEIEYMFLGLDLPPAPLFHDELQQNVIPQVALFELLNKFDGVSSHEYKTYKDTVMKTFRLKTLPKYLIMHIKRFTKNTFFVEKNPTIVNFPVKNVDLSDYIAEEDKESGDSYQFDLLANIVHDGLPGPGKGTYRAHVHHKGSKKWFEIQDLHVVDMLPEMITLSESYIQVWERSPTPVEAPVKAMDMMKEEEVAGQAPASSTA
ncbi:U4/U6.U5 tri-snRNP-associated protein 2 [Salpingoeca rosetta]|uniref:U4/U6.U5 tri-snRNP-associated protein 2 n=1 Tax=Salpingoeca rosetta (strain ATCC 50818 / BSB-021) TaxID=946362 RepID=F2U9G8_SALR5|nr:U4/U6.U5 tri-snRNP-associated protein 2 [Salpingoeca rosetta]EGD72995.1 U4/U6.U5 tri-snRNP-associated protein 2 [Salpingoeca rosetta]|eukprot:XP_004994026.1 U4/U6.U5 tri-snRNP-associated protein 2 [Salpingoeca rosetta]